MEHAINLLADQPYCGVQAQHLLLRRMRFRVLIVEYHLVFYKVRECDSTVIVYAMVDFQQDYVDLVL